MRKYRGERLARMAETIELIFGALESQELRQSIVRAGRNSWSEPHGTITLTFSAGRVGSAGQTGYNDIMHGAFQGLKWMEAP